MRIGIREQLAVLVLLAVLISLAIVSIPTWIYVNGFVGDVKRQALALTASLKAAQIASTLDQLQVISNALTSRVLVQDTVRRYYINNVTDADWASAYNALQTALTASVFVDLLQAVVYSCNATTPNSDPVRLLNITTPMDVELPYAYPNGTSVFLGDDNPLGFPPMLYPNLTQGSGDHIVEAFPGVDVTADHMLLLGPLIINDTYALISITQPMRNNSDLDDVLGYITVIAAAKDLFRIESSLEGLGDGGLTLVIGPDDEWNRFNGSFPTANKNVTGDSALLAAAPVKFVIPVVPRDGQPIRHQQPEPGNEQTFPLVKYPAALQAYSQQLRSVNNATALLETTDENGDPVSVGAARPPTSLVDWVVVVEQSQDEALAPIALLRKILLICVFATVALVLIVVLPCAHISVLPIRRLKAATEKFVAPPGYDEEDTFSGDINSAHSSTSPEKRGGIAYKAKKLLKKYEKKALRITEEHPGRMVVKMPGKIEIRRHLIVDELTDLTSTFNAMSDELMHQYTQLEDKVTERTRELELSKKAAETANQSKTLFMANVSHELKTPLNGILGMCSVCMEDNDLARIKRSLKTVYESGTLLLRLLEDLLDFARNEVGQPTRLEESLFSLAGLGKQVSAFFVKESRERGIDFAITYVNAEPFSISESKTERNAMAWPASAQALYDAVTPQNMQVWGDQHRILQIVINLISNGIKFTPSGGRIDLRIRCLGESVANHGADSEKTASKATGVARHGSVSSSMADTVRRSVGTQLQNGSGLSGKPSEKLERLTVSNGQRNRDSLPQLSTSPYIFEFEVEDTGYGIPNDIQQKVFEPFVQGEIGLARKFGGAGLGLAICRQLATLMGGSISLKSDSGAGSTFTLRVPLRIPLASSRSMALKRTSVESLQSLRQLKSESAAKAAIAVETRPNRSLDLPRFDGTVDVSSLPAADVIDSAVEFTAGSEATTAANTPTGPRVLLADDNATNLEVLSRMLLLEKVQDVEVAMDGKEAFDKVEAAMALGKSFDLIFMDIQMPEVDGIESTRLIRKLGYKQPIVALSAFAEPAVVQQCEEAGVDKFMSKPISRRAIKEVLKTMCGTVP